MKRGHLASSSLGNQSNNPTHGLIALLAALAAIGALSTNLILPSFPAIATNVGATSELSILREI